MSDEPEIAGQPDESESVPDAEEVGLMEGSDGSETIPAEVPATTATAKTMSGDAPIPAGLRAAIDSIAEFRMRLDEKEARLLHDDDDEASWWTAWERETDDMLDSTA